LWQLLSITWQAVAVVTAMVTTSVTVMVIAVAFVTTVKTIMLSGLLQWLSIVTAQAIVAVVIENRVFNTVFYKQENSW
jgi:hypothetical protein